ncbi:HNH endonuclease [Streptomyces phage Cursive]
MAYTVNMTRKKITVWTDEARLRDAVQNCKSVRECVAYLKLAHGGATYKRFRAACESFGIELSFAPFVPPNKIPDEDVFVKDSPYVNNRVNLKTRILANGWLEYKCQKCGLGAEWNGEPLVLQLDHINGKNNDHRIENLRFLCPNCHTQTDTYAGKRREIIR